MTTSLNVAEKQERLKSILQSETPEDTFERLVAALVGRLLDVGVSVAKRGFQFGGDGGPSGRRDRRFRIETKRYADETSLGQRELLGEVTQALQRDEALEAWFLAATRSVPEQLEMDLHLQGERLGVPIIVIDCAGNDIWKLVALCTVDPVIVGDMVSDEAGRLADELENDASNALAELRRDCESWQLGFDALRARSHELIRRIWFTPTTAVAKMGQDAAGGSSGKLVRRSAIHGELDRWWSATDSEAPAMLIGFEGVGKTWATIHWMVDQLDDLPICLIIPASMVLGTRPGHPSGVVGLMADQINAATGIRGVDHWIRRLDRLLRRPYEEGPALLLLIDGLNQVPEVEWETLFRTLQDMPFAGRVRTIATNRVHHYEQKLRSGQRLVVPPFRVNIGDYNDRELSLMLQLSGLRLEDLNPDLLPLARRPRLFALVLKFHDRLGAAGSVTPHRLLWEYGRDSLGTQSGRSFTEGEWRDWLRDLAERLRQEIRAYSSRALSESAARPDLLQSEVFARISDLIDGRFVSATSLGYEPTPTIVAHALGLALLERLDTLPAGSDGSATLDGWLDAIAGFDERAEVLRAAVSIMVARSEIIPSYGRDVVLAWLDSQNFPEPIWRTSPVLRACWPSR